MPLNKSSLESELNSFYSKINTTPVAAKKTATAIANYWQGGVSNFGGVPVASATISTMTSELLDAWSSTYSSSQIPVKKVANAIHTSFLSMTISGSAHGSGGIQSADKGTLESGLLDAYDLPPSREVHAAKFAAAIHAYTGTSQVFGTGVGPNFPPPSGPLA